MGNQSGALVHTFSDRAEADEWDEEVSQIDDFRRIAPPHVIVSKRPMAFGTIRRYALLAASDAVAEIDDEGRWSLSIPLMPGVWAEAGSFVDARTELEEVVYDWAILKVQDRDGDLPIVRDIDLNTL